LAARWQQSVDLASVATSLAPVEAAVDPIAATIETPIDAVAPPIEMPCGAVVTLLRCAIRSAVEAAVRPIAASVEALLDAIATIRALGTFGIRAGILGQRRSAQDRERQRQGRSEISLSHFDSP
jgi:hypothetical protein